MADEMASTEDFMRARISWAWAAQAVVQHWKKNGPSVTPQWCSDASRLLELAAELHEATEPIEVPARLTDEEIGELTDAIKSDDPATVALEFARAVERAVLRKLLEAA